MSDDPETLPRDLRYLPEDEALSPHGTETCHQAAAEIDRLRAKVARQAAQLGRVREEMDSPGELSAPWTAVVSVARLGTALDDDGSDDGAECRCPPWCPGCRRCQ